jgi:hypothetical protein
VVGNEVVGPDGARLSLSPMSFSDCPSGWVCLFADPNFGGRMPRFGNGYTGNMSDWGFNDQMSSWRNNTGVTAHWYDNDFGTWFNPCHTMVPNSVSSAVSPDNAASGLQVGNSNCWSATSPPAMPAWGNGAPTHGGLRRLPGRLAGSVRRAPAHGPKPTPR